MGENKQIVPKQTRGLLYFTQYLHHRSEEVILTLPYAVFLSHAKSKKRKKVI